MKDVARLPVAAEQRVAVALTRVVSRGVYKAEQLLKPYHQPSPPHPAGDRPARPSEWVVLDNLTLACAICNSTRRDFFSVAEMERIAELVIRSRVRALREVRA